MSERALPGLAGLAPALCYLLIMQGADSHWATAAVVGMLALACAVTRYEANPSMNARTLWLCALSSLIGGVVFLPLAGARMTILAGVLLAAFQGWRSRRVAAAGTASRADLWRCGWAAAAAVCWTRCLSLMAGNSVIGFTSAITSLAAGAALALWARERWRANWETSTAAVAAGTLGLAILHFIRFIGLNTGSPLHLYAPLRCLSDVGVQVVQPALALAAWAFLLAFPENSPDNADPPYAVLICFAGAAPIAAAALMARLGPALSAVVINGTLIAWGIVAKIRTWHRTGGLAGARQFEAKLLGVSLLAALWLGGTAGHTFADVWLNRLNAAYPGGRFLALDEGGCAALGIYQFSTGLKILIRDGVADAAGQDLAKHEAHLPLLTHTGPRRTLLVGALQPASWNAAALDASQVDVLETVPTSPAFRLALTDPSWTPAPGVRFVREAGRDYDVILIEPPVPAHSPEAARLTTAQALRAWRRRLAAHGILAVRVPAPYFGIAAGRIIRTMRAEFNWAGAFRLPGELLVLASDDPISAGSGPLLARLTPAVLRDDPDLKSYIEKGQPWSFFERFEPTVDHLSPDNADRSRNALPFWEILTAPAPRF
jgi:hypothetical protein